MAEVSYIDPLSNEGKGIISNHGDLNQIFDEDESLIEVVPEPQIKGFRIIILYLNLFMI